VCHVLVDGKLYFASEKKARKVRNLRANPDVAVTVDLYSDAWSNLKGVMVQGTATLIAKGPRFRRIRNALYAKYPQYPEQAAIGGADSVVVEVTPTNVFSWGLE
jgi:nitroimidazol reductase NimA-like FMN-containing flavoprotein (pyridoxamine 5'-phosphate oxidase superfamily)